MSDEEFMIDHAIALRFKIIIGVMVGLIGLFFYWSATMYVKEISLDQQFRSERYIAKICHDGTRIYNWNGRTVTGRMEPILPEACQ